MEGPTPVSALLHAATMVTAGVFLIIRFAFVFENCDEILVFVILIGSFTAIIFSIIATFQYDIKKIIAYSTCSQLGYMFFCCGLSQYQVAIFHLFNHAFFKALLFLGAGSVIHALNDEQDLRKMGALSVVLPFTFVCITVGSLAIMGIPFLTGFYSKDIILELASSRFLLEANFIFFLSISAAFFTAVYSTRLILFLGFWYNNSFRVLTNFSEGNLFMCIPMLFLSILSIFVGFFFSDFFIG